MHCIVSIECAHVLIEFGHALCQSLSLDMQCIDILITFGCLFADD